MRFILMEHKKKIYYRKYIMSLAELLSDSKSFNMSGNFDTAYRFVSVDNKIATATLSRTRTCSSQSRYRLKTEQRKSSEE